MRGEPFIYPPAASALVLLGDLVSLYLAVLRGERHAKAFRQLPFLIPIAWQSTNMEPCRGLYAELAAMESEAVPTR